MQLATWVQTLPVILMIIVAVYLPGAVIVLACGRRNLDVIALAPVVSIAIAGVGGVLAYPLGIRWGWAAYLLSALIVFVMVFAVRVALVRTGRGRFQTDSAIMRFQERHCGRSDTAVASHGVSRRIVGRRGVWAAPVFGVALAAGTIAVRLAHAAPSPDQVTQNYDSVFHDNIVARIIMTGDASSLHALPPIREVYPIAFQQFAALGALAVPHTTGPAAIIAAWLVFAALIWPCSMLFLVRSICGSHPLTDIVAPVLSAVCAGFPFLLLDWGTLYSMFAGQVILPVFLALAWTWCLHGWADGARVAVPGLAWIMVACIAISVCHFRVMMTGILLVLPLLVVWVWDVLHVVHRRSATAFHVMVWVGVLAVAGVAAIGFRIFGNMYLRGASRPIADHLNGGPARPTENMPSAVLRYLLGQPINAANQRMPVFWPVAVMLLIALVLAVVAHSRESLILLASFVLLGFVFVSSAGTHADWAKVVTALWYKDQRRLFAAWPIAGIALICWAMRYLIDGYRQSSMIRNGVFRNGALHNSAFRNSALRRYPRVTRGIAGCVVAALAVAACAVNPQLDSMQDSVARTYAFAADGTDNPMLSKDEYLLLKRMWRDVPENQQVVSDPWNGSGFLLAVGWRVPFYPHLSMMWDHDHDYLARNLHAIGTDPEVCAIIQRNDLHWYLDMGGSFAPDDPQHVMFTGMKVVPDAMRMVDHQGRAALYRITACGMGD